jgi:arsenate reductase
MKIYHNPRCSKSRCALEWLQENKFDVTVVDYQKAPLTVEELRTVLQALNMRPEALMRKNEEEYTQHIQGKNLSDDEMIVKMIEFPKLMERPIIVWGNQAVIARPLEKLEEALGSKSV